MTRNAINNCCRQNDRLDIVGQILVKELLWVEPEAGIRVGELTLRMLPHLSADTPLYDLLKLFESGRSHMAVVTEPPVVTIASLQADAMQAAAALSGGGSAQALRSRQASTIPVRLLVPDLLSYSALCFWIAC